MKSHSILQVFYGIDLSAGIFPTLSETLGCFIVNQNQTTNPPKKGQVRPRTLAMLKSVRNLTLLETVTIFVDSSDRRSTSSRQDLSVKPF